MSLALKFREHEEIGDLSRIVTQVRNGNGKGSEEQIIDILCIDREQYDQISEMIEKNPGMSDSDVAESILDERDATSDV
ncbi:MAG: hypothetical protein IK077_16300 [Thermoguttaceae bacterium]|nr:hypothetical protein [Thermoguttaceae bacterium]